MGFATPLVFFFAAARLRSGRVWIACASYTAVLVIEQVSAADHFGMVANGALAIPTLGAVAHALILREEVFLGRSRVHRRIIQPRPRPDQTRAG